MWQCESPLWLWQELMTRVIGQKTNYGMFTGNRKRTIGHSEYRWVSYSEIFLRKKAEKEKGRWNESCVQRVAFLMTCGEGKIDDKEDRGDNCICNCIGIRGWKLGRYWP